MQQPNRIQQLNWKDYWRVVQRRRWQILVPFFVCGLAGFLIAHVWPARYKSEAMILVVQQKVPDKYVTPNVVSSADSRLQSLTQEILSRTRLQQIIERFNLYPKDRSSRSLDELVDRMRNKDIEITPVKSADHPDDLTAFKISYLAPSPKVAQQVVNELTSLFIEENLRARTQQSAGTTSFFESELQSARDDLAEKEKRLSDYKMKYLGELPEQQQSNMEILRNLETQMGAASGALDRAQQEKTYLESMKSQYLAIGASGSNDGSGGMNPDVKLKELRAKLADLESQLTPQHPDVIEAKADIAHWEQIKKNMEATSGKEPAANDEKAMLSASGTQPNLIDVQSRLKAVQLDIARKSAEMKSLQGKMGAIEGRLNLTPVREQELAGVTRDVESAKDNYNSLLQKKSQSQLATNLEESQQGEQFRVVDAPGLPQKPAEPNRAEILIGGCVLGLIVGAALVTLKESSDTKMRGEKAFRAVATFPVFVSIPAVQSPREESRARSRLRLEMVLATFLSVSLVASVVYTFMVG